MPHIRRYAIYWLPEGALGAWGESWLGWNMALGAPLPRTVVAGLPAPVEALTQAATAYGLHATIKPPFRLAPGTTEDGLRAALAAFCAASAPVAAGGLALSDLGGFLALTPQGDTAALDALAGRTVAALDAFRAPAPPDETARRRAAGLTPTQEALLTRWGYPYVMEEFRFHVTLTGRLPPDQRGPVADILRPILAPHLPHRLHVAALSLVGQTDDGFRTLAHHALAG
jgi:hypothetical protein